MAKIEWIERFMRNLGKVMRNTGTSQTEWEKELIEFLRNYRDTPHSSTGVAPNRLLFQSLSKTSKLPNFSDIALRKDHLHQEARVNDSKAKTKMKTYNDNKLKAKESSFKVGDVVLLKWKRSRKSDSLFDPHPFRITKLNGSMVALKRNGSILIRNSSFIKHYLQDEENSNSQILRELLIGEDTKLNSEKKKEFETGDDNSQKYGQGVESRTEGQESSGNKKMQENENQRPRRSTKKPDRYGDPIEYGTRSYTKRSITG